jgi:hypothetical protein
MTRKDYKKIAEIVGEISWHPKYGSDRVGVLVSAIQKFSDCFCSDNPKFDKEKFEEKCWESFRNTV